MMDSKRRLPSLVAGALAALWVPLTGLALAMGWRSTFQVDRPGRAIVDFIAHGSAISGPLAPHVVMAIAAIVSRRPGKVGAVATSIIGLLGVLLIGNAIAGAVSAQPIWTPRPIILAGAALYLAFGVAFIVTAARALRAL